VPRHASVPSSSPKPLHSYKRRDSHSHCLSDNIQAIWIELQSVGWQQYGTQQTSCFFLGGGESDAVRGAMGNGKTVS